MSKIVISELKSLEKKSFLDNLNPVHLNTILGGHGHSHSKHNQEHEKKHECWHHK